MARDIPGVLDVLFPRLSGGLVAHLNKKMFTFDNIKPIPEALIEKSRLQKAMVFELAMVRAEFQIEEQENPDWDECLRLASARQRRHYDAKIPDTLEEDDIHIAAHAAHNLVSMLRRIQAQAPDVRLKKAPRIPGLGWIAPGTGDFAFGSVLIEVKHTNRNFTAGDFRQVLMYWLLKYASSIESKSGIWTDVLLLNPRRNCGLAVNFDHLLRSASSNSNRVELAELLRSMVGMELDRR